MMRLFSWLASSRDPIRSCISAIGGSVRSSIDTSVDVSAAVVDVST